MTHKVVESVTRRLPARMMAIALQDPVARPFARGVTREERRTVDLDEATFSSSMSAPWLCSAFAIADSSTLWSIAPPSWG